jgi:predicted metal-binding membrane protein
MNLVVAFSPHAGVRVAEVGFLLVLIAGVWLALAETLQPDRWRRFRTIVAGVVLAVAGLLLIIATHWGHFGGG